MKRERNLNKQGGSYVITIPKVMCEILEINQTDTLELELIGKKIIITKKN